mgnify:CR=1 FL=1|jgi:hypothetical protein
MDEKECTCECECCGVTEEISLPNIVIHITYNDNSTCADSVNFDGSEE